MIDADQTDADEPEQIVHAATRKSGAECGNEAEPITFVRSGVTCQECQSILELRHPSAVPDDTPGDDT